MNLYDYIYVDIDIVASLYSQLTGGVVELREEHREKSRTADNKRRYDFKIFQHDAGGTAENVEAQKEIIKPHHALFQELERGLADLGHLVDLSALGANRSLRDETVRAAIKRGLCLKCTGRVVIEDYERIKSVAAVFPDIVQLINRSNEESIKTSEAYLTLEAQVREFDTHGRDRNEKARAKQEARKLRSRIDEELKAATHIDPVAKWVLQGMKTWIDAFLPGITNVRLYPSEATPDEHVFGHLDPVGFTVADTNAFHFTYGSFPTEPLTLLGIVTSVPDESTESFDPLEEFNREVLADYESVEKAFRGLFRGFDGIEAMIRTIRYPRVLVNPILVYREAEPHDE